MAAMDSRSHITGHKKSGLFSSVTALRGRSKLFVWPVVATVLLLSLGWFVNRTVENSAKAAMAGNLTAILDADVVALQLWLEQQKAVAETTAEDPEVRRMTAELVELAASAEGTHLDIIKSDTLRHLLSQVEMTVENHEYNGFGLIDRNGKILAAMREELIGKQILNGMAITETVLGKNRSMVTRPYASAVLLEGTDGTARAGVPTMLALAPVRDDTGAAIAGVGFRIRPEMDFSRILSVARAGATGETYAFDANGLLISWSRFDDELKRIGLLTDNDETMSILNIQVRDPGINLELGKRPKLRRSEQPLTRMAAHAVQGKSGLDVDGYRDYRGVPVIGAWTWLDEYGFGVATEVDVAEAYRPLYLLRRILWILFALIAAGAGAVFVFSILVARANRKARHAAIEARQLGQYSLDEKIGAGGMGVVYRGRHAMLRRPTAIKLLDAEQTSEETIARFEREVQLTSQLNHPNTIAIYDFGRTPEGVFYYAMEYLDGIDLDELIKRHGPQPAGRVIHLLSQACGSLAEAHGVGLIHRDIKPANLILTRRGGIADFLKVLDFGLVKALDGRKQAALTQADKMAGTPAYMSPESINTPDAVDARTDLYAVGAVGYFLLAGRPVFEGAGALEVVMKQTKELPVPPSERLGRPLCGDLESLILSCLAKSPADRPESVTALSEALGACASASSWSAADAHNWWTTHFSRDSGETASNATVVLDRSP